MKLQEARDMAVKICTQLQPYCDKINIAGSIRRKKSEVKDIEIVALPKTQIIYGNSLFGEWNKKTIRSQKFIETVNNLGVIKKGNTAGKMMQIELPEWIMLDLFIPDDFDYYRQYAIRTGSADYSHKVLATGWNKKGWVGSDKGLRKITDCEGTVQSDGKTKWKCIEPEAQEPPIWESEQDFFSWINVKWISAELRNFQFV